MQYFALLTAGLSFLVSGASSATLGSAASLSACDNEVVASETFIGKDHNVKLTTSHCDGVPQVSSQGALLNKRQHTPGPPVNVCGNQCPSARVVELRTHVDNNCAGDTHCFNPSGGGPNESDCAVIADALLYEEQNVGDLFNVTYNSVSAIAPLAHSAHFVVSGGQGHHGIRQLPDVLLEPELQGLHLLPL